MMHNQATYRKYEQILGVSFQETCDERTDFTTKLAGIRIADKAKSFWAVVRGEIDAPDKTLIT